LDLDKILSELRSERDTIGKVISALLDGAGAAISSNGLTLKAQARGRGKGMTTAGRKRLSEATKARWAARRSKSAPTSNETTKRHRKVRRGMSAAGRKRIAEAMKRRWAEKRKATSRGGTSLKVKA
jgi:hypothetical protein